MKIREKTSMNNSQKEIKFDDFMDNAYEQINKDISKILFEMRKENQKGTDNDNNNITQKFLDNEDKVNNMFYANQQDNKLIPNINNSFIDIKMNNYFNNNNTLMNTKMLRYNNIIENNSMIKPNKIIKILCLIIIRLFIILISLTKMIMNLINHI